MKTKGCKRLLALALSLALLAMLLPTAAMAAHIWLTVRTQIEGSADDSMSVGISISENTTIGALKEILQEKILSDLPMDQKKLSYNGQELDDDSKTLVECGISTETFVDLFLKSDRFAVTGYESGYTYEKGVLTVKNGAEITVSKSNPDSGLPIRHRIVVEQGAEAHITLSNVDIEVVNLTQGFKYSPFDTTGAKVRLTLEGENTLKGGNYRAGLEVPSGAELTIDGNGKLTAAGGNGGAGIGACGINAVVMSRDCGTIHILGGTVIAKGGAGGAGIGGGSNGGSGGTITISGRAHVEATGSGGSYDIGSSKYGADKGTLSVTDGATLEMKGIGASADDPTYNDCTVISQDGKTYYDENGRGRAVTGLSLSVSPADSLTLPGSVTLTATLTGASADNSDKAIVFTVNGSLHTEQTNASGEAVYTVTNPEAREYTFGASFAGDENNTPAAAAEVSGYLVGNALAITGVPGTVYKGDSFPLSTAGGLGGGAVSWSVVSGPATIDSTGKVSVTGTGDITVKAVKAADGIYKQTEATVTFTARSSGGGSRTPSASDKLSSTVEKAKDGDTVRLDLPGGGKLPGAVLDAAAGRDITLEIDAGGGAVWIIHGRDIPTGKKLADLNLKVNVKADPIPVTVLNALTGEKKVIQLELAHSGAFDFPLTLRLETGRESAGLWANLYHYDGAAGTLAYQSAAQVGADGAAALPFAHASSYAVVLDRRSHANPFLDVAESDWFYAPVLAGYRQGVLTGTSADTFDPAAPVTRAMTAATLYRLAGSPPADGEGAAFSDVAPGAWYADAVVWCAAQRVVSGYGEGRFGPEDAITREQLVALLYRFAQQQGRDVSVGEDTNILSYADAFDVSEYAIPAFQWACGAGIVSGTADGRLNPQGGASRAELAAMLARYLTEKH